ncbi:MAG TPA: PASTA domain-containing protein [Acidimicrobiales bacterium]|nr:PASTA domain-containing protein [Acidimicrobiales bacterium]
MVTITDSIGRVLAGRYRIESALGTGASAHVFAAWDVNLHRRVAVKVLHPALAADTAFLRRFLAEAQSAASLTHANVLRVYDWGEDEGGPFLVFELCGGGSLRDLLDSGGRLTVAQALAVGAEAADGLAYAHARGFVHRDVKPANLLFGEDGTLQVADFGLARALAEAAWTEPVGATVGTARYAAPEQALGRPVDGAADVYALALVLYEAVTGVVPFTADTTVATLMARVGARLPGHDALGPLAPVLDAATVSEPDQRIDASSLAARLRALSGELPDPEPLPLAGPGGRRVGTGPARPPERDWRREDDLTELGLGTATAHASGSPSASGPSPAGQSDTTEGARRPAPRWLLRAAVITVAALVLAGALAYGAVASQLLVASHRLPAVTGQSRAAAAAALRRDHLVLRVTRERSSFTVPAGNVLREIPAAGTSVKEGTIIGVVLSSGPPPVVVPSLSSVTKGCGQVVSMLAVDHLQAACVPEASASVASGSVISWSPQGHAPYGSSVHVVVSSGPPVETIPSLTGSTCQGATTALQAIGFKIQCQQAYSTSVPNGQVISWSPTNQAPEGTMVVVQVSQGPPPVPVPDVYGDDLAQAYTAIENAGLQVGAISGPGSGRVVASSPSPETMVSPGTTVDLTMQ